MFDQSSPGIATPAGPGAPAVQPGALPDFPTVVNQGVSAEAQDTPQAVPAAVNPAKKPPEPA